ncbi:hypothetical protein H310_08643 [Aphanomyces invadans]|uniref:Integrase catalytic domain-containing protein n=1 Tax=Aphanomyces invadans TaxID=157072 RepID=A0A024TX08_9STRA|nr:hypothetical protein H310_08643 [Aphanomyces invadans]ETV98504.1 hypothetical protein H310_08643 [Aphanomyces invadans]|eukprot:XP_008872701.1 hypothetical protein H310_08643 [Aphanomyces invadans]
MVKYQADKLQRWALVMSTFPYTIESVSGEDNDFEWPTAQSVLKSQKNGLQDEGQPPPGVTWNDDIKFYVTPGDKIWVPDDDLDLQQRLCVITHQGAAGHRRVAAKMHLSRGIKDDMSGFVRLFPSQTADVTATAAALMDCFTTSGIVTTWVSDCGSHFKNEVIEKANGSVEVVNKMLLPAVKALLSEWRFPATQWPMVLSLVQGALNHQLSNRLGGLATATAFGGFDATSPLSWIVHPTTKEVWDVDWLDKSRIKHVQNLRKSIDEMHRDASVRSEKLRSQAIARQRKK